MVLRWAALLCIFNCFTLVLGPLWVFGVVYLHVSCFEMWIYFGFLCLGCWQMFVGLCLMLGYGCGFLFELLLGLCYSAGVWFCID